MPQLTACKAFRYSGRALKVGDGFAASKTDAKVLVAIGRASYMTAAIEVPEVVKVEEGDDPEVAEVTAPKVTEVAKTSVRKGNK